MSFCDWLVLFNIMTSCPIQMVVNDKISSFVWPLVHCVDVPRLLYAFSSGWMLRLCLLPVMKGATINTGRCVWQTDFTFCGCILSSRIVTSYGRSDSGFWKNHHAGFHSGFLIYISTDSIRRVHFFSSALLSFVFLISSKSNWSEEISQCGFKKCLFRSDAHFSVRVIWRGGCCLSSLT